VQYALLVHIFAKVSGLLPGELLHVIADAHIYDRHIPIIEELISRPTFDAPKLEIGEITDFYKVSPDDFKLDGYKFNEFTTKIPIAI
jgi:thymidylate synthase